MHIPIMQIKISITKEFISFRSEARNIQLRVKKELKKNHSSAAVLDFSKVTFISRSFADELVAIFSASIRTIKSKNPKSQILNPKLVL